MEKTTQRHIKKKDPIPNEKPPQASFLLGLIVDLLPTEPEERETKPRRTARIPITMKGTYIISNLSDAFPEPIISPRIAA